MSKTDSGEKGIQHIAFIMDGNGRWAKARGLTRDAGHRAGVEAFRRVVSHCGDIGIPIVTVYAFSTENWKRPAHEVSLLMKLLADYLEGCADEMMSAGVRFRAIGDKTPFKRELRESIEKLEKLTENNPRVLNVALNYGGRDELVHAFNRLAQKGVTNIKEEDISRELYTADLPDPDLIVRSSGELRLSNFLIWQGAYSELYFTDTLWPDMTDEDVDLAVLAYKNRHRRYGGL